MELGSVKTQGHPLKRVWDAALLLHGMGYLHFEVSKPACPFPHSNVSRRWAYDCHCEVQVAQLRWCAWPT